MRASVPQCYVAEVGLVAVLMGTSMVVVIALVDVLAGVPWPW